jgi:hypothetical protein
MGQFIVLHPVHPLNPAFSVKSVFPFNRCQKMIIKKGTVGFLTVPFFSALLFPLRRFGRPFLFSLGDEASLHHGFLQGPSGLEAQPDTGGKGDLFTGQGISAFPFRKVLGLEGPESGKLHLTRSCQDELNHLQENCQEFTGIPFGNVGLLRELFDKLLSIGHLFSPPLLFRFTTHSPYSFEEH